MSKAVTRVVTVERDEDRLVVAPAGLRALSQQVLRTDVAGMPLEWIDYREAARLYHMEQVAYSAGSLLYRLFGGTNALSGLRTVVDVNSIIATVGHTHNPGNLRGDYTPPLNNQTLFRRDGHVCMYCGMRFPASQLSRDHIRPFSQGGGDTWTNVVAACLKCNLLKGNRTLDEARLRLIREPVHPQFLFSVHLLRHPHATSFLDSWRKYLVAVPSTP